MEKTHAWTKGLTQGHNQVSHSDSSQVYVDGGQYCVPRKERYFPHFRALQFITHKGLYEVLMQLPSHSADNCRDQFSQAFVFTGQHHPPTPHPLHLVAVYGILIFPLQLVWILKSANAIHFYAKKKPKTRIPFVSFSWIYAIAHTFLLPFFFLLL